MHLLLGFESACLLLGAILLLMKYSLVQRDNVTLYNLMVKENLWGKADPCSGSVPALNQVIYNLGECMGSGVIMFILFLIFLQLLIFCHGPEKFFD